MDFARFAYGIREAAAVVVILIIFPLLVDKGTKVFIGKSTNVVAAEEQMEENNEQKNAFYRQLDNLREDSSESKDLLEQINKLDVDQKAQVDIVQKWLNSIKSTRFYIALVVGLLAIIAGVLIDVPSLGTGLVLGGGFVISRGYWDYWNFISDAFAFVSLLVALLAIAAALWYYARKR